MTTLAQVLTESLPALRDTSGKLSVPLLAQALGCTRQNLWLALHKNNRISADNARILISLPGSTLTAEQVLPFIR